MDAIVPSTWAPRGSRDMERSRSLLEAATGTKLPDAHRQLVSAAIAHALLAIAEKLNAIYEEMP